MNMVIIIKNKAIRYSLSKITLVRDSFVKSRKGWFFLICMVSFTAIIYASQYLLLLSPKNREIMGISLQLLAGFVLILDQIFIKVFSPETNTIDWFNELYRKGKFKFVLLLLLISFPVVLITALTLPYVLFGEIYAEDTLPWTAFGGMWIFLLFGYYSYLYPLTSMTKLFDKLGRKYQSMRDNPNNILFSNATLLVISILLAYVSLYIYDFNKGIPNIASVPHSFLPMTWYFISTFAFVLWFFVTAFFILPVMLLSLSLFIVLGIVEGFRFFRRPNRRITFWILIIILWFAGGLILLINACNA